MARPIWTGSLSFGLVSVPVGLYSAIEQKDIRFHQFQQGTKRRIHNQRVAEGTKKEVPYEKVVKGYEVVDRISNVPTGDRNRPQKDVVIKKVTISDEQPK